MKEVKSPKKPLFYYYGIVLLIIIVFNVLVTPMLTKTMVKEVDYGTFMSKIEDKKIDDVQIEDNQILFTDRDDANTVYKTGVMEDPTLTERLYKAGAKFSKEIDQQTSPVCKLSADRCPSACDLYCVRPVYEPQNDESDGRQKFHGIRNGKKQRKGLCTVNRRNPLQ